MVVSCGVAGTLLMSALAISCTAAQAAAVIVPVGARSSASPLDLSRLPRSPDVARRSYSVISSPGRPARTVTVTGYSLGGLLNYAGVSQSSFNVAEVFAPGGRPVLFSNAQVRSASAFRDGPPVAWQDSKGSHFLRPSTGANDANASDFFTDDTVTTYLHSGALLTVRSSTSARRVGVGKPVKLTAAVSGGLPGEALDYQWHFDDGNGASHASVTHAYADAGTYEVYLRVAGSRDSLGVSMVTPIQVGKPPKGPNRQGGGTSDRSQSPTHGGGVGGSQPGTGGGTRGGAGSRTAHTLGPAARIEPSRPHPVPKPRPRTPKPAGPVLSGIAVTGAPQAGTAATPPASRGGGSRAARTGHLTPAHHGLREGFWLALGVLAMVVLGAALEGVELPRIQSQLRLTISRLR